MSGVEPFGLSVADLLRRWQSGLESCGTHPIVLGQDDCGCTELVMECCGTPPCPETQRKASREWQERADECYAFFERLRLHPEPRSSEWCERALAVQKKARGKRYEKLRRRIDAALAAANFAAHKGQRWVHVEVGVHGHGLSKAEHVVKTLDTRTVFARHMRRAYHTSAADISLDLGTDKQGPHFHALMLIDYAPRELLQRWLRSTDCTVPGCSHEADDRCESCRAAGHACHHARPDGKPRCNGSWYVHVQQVGTKCKTCGRRVGEATCCGTSYVQRVRDGFREVLKYAAAPVEVGNAPVPGEPFNPRQLQHAEGVLQFFVLTRHRHRIESYGAAKLHLAELGLVEPTRAERLKGCCPCGNRWTWELHGWRKPGGNVEWGCMLPYQGCEGEAAGSTGPPELGRPAWVQESFPGVFG